MSITLEIEINVLVAERELIRHEQKVIAKILDFKVREEQERLRREIEDDPERRRNHKGIG